MLQLKVLASRSRKAIELPSSAPGACEGNDTQHPPKNLFCSFLFNGIGVPMAAAVLYPVSGILTSPMFAGVAMTLSSFTAVMNAVRLNRAKLLQNSVHKRR